MPRGTWQSIYRQKKKALRPPLYSSGWNLIFNDMIPRFGKMSSMDFYRERLISSPFFFMIRSLFIFVLLLKLSRSWLTAHSSLRRERRRSNMILSDWVIAFLRQTSMVRLLVPTGLLISHSTPSI